MRFIRRARRTKPMRVSFEKRRASAGSGVVGEDFERRDAFAAVTYDRVLIS
jgi:hypothetical protein